MFLLSLCLGLVFVSAFVQYHAVFVTAELEYNIKSDIVMSSITLSTQDCFGLCESDTVFRLHLSGSVTIFT